MTGITEPLEFSFLFVAPALFAVQVVLAGSAYMIAHILNIAVGLTFSGGFLDLFLFGILQGNAKTSWLRIIPVGIIYFFLFNFKTPGREDDDTETKLYTKADVNARKEAGKETAGNTGNADPVSEAITQGLGGKKNISDVDCCATRLRITVHDAARVNDEIIKTTGSRGIVKKGQGVQIIYGPQVTVIKSKLEDYLETAPDEYYESAAVSEENSAEENTDTVNENNETQEKVVNTIVVSSPITGMAGDITTCPDEGFVENGQKVKKGDPLMKIDIPFLASHAPSLCSPVLCTELEENQRVRLLATGEVKAGDPLFAVDTVE